MSILDATPAFKRLFVATGISNLGDGIAAMAVPWLAALITRDPFLVGLVTFGQRLPWLVFSLPAGVITDRVARRKLIVSADLVRVGLVALIAVLAFGLNGPGENALLRSGALALLAFALGIAEVFRDNAAQTFLPSVVERRDLETANGRLWSVEHIAALLGPPIAGALIAIWLPLPFLAVSLAFLVAAGLILGIQTKGEVLRTAEEKRSLLSEMAEGWAWLKAHGVILRLALMLGVLNFASMTSMVILVLYTQDVLGLGPFGHGVILACGAAGGVAAGTFGPAVVKRLGADAAVRLALVIMTVSPLLFVVFTSPIAAGLGESLALIGGVLWNIVTVSYRQRHIPDALLGRVNSIYRFFGWGSISLAALFGGALASSLEPFGRDMALRAPYAFGAVLTSFVLIYAWRRLRLG